MKSQTSNRLIELASIVFLVLLPACARTVVGQTNTFPESGNVGIGTTSPGEKLEVVGNIKLPPTATATSGTSYPSHLLRLYGSGWATAYGAGISTRVWDVQAIGKYSTYGDSDFGFFYNGQSTPALYILGSAGYPGNVGIGTTSPGEKLEVVGSIKLPPTATATSGTSYPSHSLRLYGSGWATAYGAGISTRVWDFQAIGKYSTYGDSDFGLFYNGQTTPALYILGSSGYAGNVGIGTTAPTYKLQVVAPSGTSGVGITFNSATEQAFQITNTNTSGKTWSIGPGIGTAAGDFGIYNATDSTLGLQINTAGNVGIGTTGPANYKLQVAAPSGTTALGLSFNSATEQAFQITNTNTGGKTWSMGPGVGNAAGDFGIYNVTDSTLGLTVYANGSVKASNLLSSSGNVGLPSAVGGIVYLTGGYSSPNSGRFIFGDGSGWKMHFSKRSSSTTSDLITFQDNGRIGVGTDIPTEKLDVVGNINVSGAGAGNITLSGTINAKYQDVAEWVHSSEQLAPATVVVLDSSKSNQVIASSVSYDTRVAGVISERPGLALGEQGEGKVLVATTGRVRIKVDATKSPIQIGDLLVTSDIPGVAMKSEAVNLGGVQFHRPGTLIGKALEPLAKGAGEILVLLSLQ